MFGLSGHLDIPWTADEGFTDDVTYNDVKLDVGDVVSSVATPFAGRRPLPGSGPRRRRRPAHPDPGRLGPLRARRWRRGVAAEPARDVVGRDPQAAARARAPGDRPGRRGHRHDPRPGTARGQGRRAGEPLRRRRTAQPRPVGRDAAREVHPGGHHLDDEAEPRRDQHDQHHQEGPRALPGRRRAGRRAERRGRARSDHRGEPQGHAAHQGAGRHQDPGDHGLAARVLAAVPHRPRPAHRHADRRGRGVVLPPRPRHPGRAGRLQADLRADHGRTDPDHAVRRRLDLDRGPARDGVRLLRADPGGAVGQARRRQRAARHLQERLRRRRRAARGVLPRRPRLRRRGRARGQARHHPRGGGGRLDRPGDRRPQGQRDADDQPRPQRPQRRRPAAHR